MCIAQKLGQGRASTRRDDIKRLEGRIFHPAIFHNDWKFHNPGCFDKKGAFFGGRLVQSHGNTIPQEFRQH